MNNDDGAMEVFFDAMMTGDSSGAIMRQEARGQRELVNSSRLPKDINFGSREQFERMGIVFGESEDDLFVNVTLPESWSLKPADHSMWSYLVDDKGHKRADIFYKAAFYDRSAHMSINRRYSYRTQPMGGYDQPNAHDINASQECVVVDGNTDIWTSPPATPAADIPRYQIREQLELLGFTWLAEHFPNWEDPLAYWD